MLSCHIGGSPAQAELIHERIRWFAQESKTPVYTFAEDVAASGGCVTGPMHALFKQGCIMLA